MGSVRKGFAVAIPALRAVLFGLFLVGPATGFAVGPGALFGYGNNSSGELGTGNRVDGTDVLVADDVVEVIAGPSYVFFFKKDGSLWGVGNNTDGQLGLGDNEDRLTPVKILDEALTAAAGSFHSLVVTPDGSLWATGLGNNGQLGLGDFLSRNTWGFVDSDVVSVAAGSAFSVYVKRDGSVHATGNNNDSNPPYDRIGKTGFDADLRVEPTKVADDMVRVVASRDHTLLLKENGVLYGMGKGEPMGLGLSTNRFEPAPLAAGVVDMAAGIRHSVWINENGNLLGTGFNGNGQLGPDVPFAETGLFLIDEGGNNVEVAAGPLSSLVSRRAPDGALFLVGWGPNSSGALGDPTDPQPFGTGGTLFRTMDLAGTTSYLLGPLNILSVHFGGLRAVRNRVFDSDSLGRLHFRFPSQVSVPETDGVDQAFRQAWSESLQTLITTDGSELRSPEYGVLDPGGDPGWVASEFFGWVYSGATGETYSGFVSSERFGWMSFVAEEGGATYLWVPGLFSWFEVQPNGSFYGFDFRELVPTGLNTYESPVLGTVTTGDFGGCVSSSRFGWVWAARGSGGVWFWSEGRSEWLGVTPDGGVWSTAEGRFL